MTTAVDVLRGVFDADMNHAETLVAPGAWWVLPELS